MDSDAAFGSLGADGVLPRGTVHLPPQDGEGGQEASSCAVGNGDEGIRTGSGEGTSYVHGYGSECASGLSVGEVQDEVLTRLFGMPHGLEWVDEAHQNGQDRPPLVGGRFRRGGAAEGDFGATDTAAAALRRIWDLGLGSGHGYDGTGARILEASPATPLNSIHLGGQDRLG